MPNCVLASVNKTFKDLCTDVSKFFWSRKFGFEDQLDPINSKHILNSILNEEFLSDGDSEEPIEESWTNELEAL